MTIIIVAMEPVIILVTILYICIVNNWISSKFSIKPLLVIQVHCNSYLIYYDYYLILYKLIPVSNSVDNVAPLYILSFV